MDAKGRGRKKEIDKERKKERKQIIYRPTS
jgi:hypothetical protein